MNVQNKTVMEKNENYIIDKRFYSEALYQTTYRLTYLLQSGSELLTPFEAATVASLGFIVGLKQARIQSFEEVNLLIAVFPTKIQQWY